MFICTSHYAVCLIVFLYSAVKRLRIELTLLFITAFNKGSAIEYHSGALDPKDNNKGNKIAEL